VQAEGRGKPYLNLKDGREMQVAFVGNQRSSQALQSAQANARALASADLDGNGTPDLVTGYGYSGGGMVTIQRGNPDAFAPKDEAVFARMQQGYNPESLLPEAETYSVPEPVDFVQVGDFNHDNRKDVLVAARGGNLFLLAGDGSGGLSAPEQIALSGTVTTLAAGEFGAPDGWTDLAVSVAGPSGAELLIYDGVKGVTGEPMRAPLGVPATAIEFGELDSSPFRGLVVATGSQIQIIHGWGRKQSPPLQSQIEVIDAGSNVRGLAIGFFIWNRDANKQIAALGEDGTIRVLMRGQTNTQPLTDLEMTARARLRLQPKDTTKVDVETLSGWQAGQAESWTKARELVTGNFVGADATSQNLLRGTHISFTQTDDLLVLGGSNKLEIVRQVDALVGAKANLPTTAGDMITISLDTAAAPAAVLALPQKLNGERSLLLLEAGRAAPTVVPLAPTVAITVDRTDDPSGVNLPPASVCGASANDCSLRGAVQFANANLGTVINLGTATYTLNTNGTGGCVRESLTTGNTIGDLEVNNTTTMMGTGQASTIINQIGTGNASFPGDRVLCMDVNLTPNRTYTFSAMTIAGGRDAASGIGGGGFIGGAKDTTLTLSNVTFANNQTSPGVPQGPVGGGAISVTGGNMNVTDCTIGAANFPGASRTSLTLGNAANNLSGGGISYSAGDPAGSNGAMGTLTITGTTFTHNTSSSVSAGGGGLDVLEFNVSVGTANISTSAFDTNQATGTASGGGIINASMNSLTIATTSFTNNSAGNRGGGLYVGGGNGTFLNGTSPSITFSGNTAGTAGSSISAAGAVTVSGINTTVGGDLEITTNGIWTNSAASAISPTNFIMTGTANFTGNNSTTNVSGNFTFGSGTFNAGTGTFNFSGGGPQSITNSSLITFSNLVVAKTGGSTLTLNSSASVASNLTVTSGVFDLQGNTVNRTAAGGTLTVSNGSTLKIGGTNPLPTNYSTHSIGATSTIEYSGTSQTVSTLNSSQSYGNLTISGSGTKTLGGAISVATKLTITAGTLDVSASNFALNMAGDFTNNVAAANFNPRSGTVTFNGPAAQNINGTTTSHTFSGLTSNRTGTGDLTLGSNTTVNGLLTLTSGNITTGANTLSIGSAGTRSRTSGYILGNEKKTYDGAGSFIFDVGTANGYSPVDSTVTAGTGDLTVLAVQGAQPSVVSSRSLQRYWTLTEGGAGITANLLFHYLDPPDVMGNEANYQVLQVTGGARTYFVNNCPAPCVDAAANTAAINGVTSFSDWTAGEARADLQVTSVTDAPDPVIAGNNITYTINFINNGPDTSSNVTVTDAVPANTTFVSASMPAGWTRTDVVPPGGTGNIVFAKGNVASAEAAALQVVVNVNSNATGGSTITNSATAASAVTTDSIAGNNTGTAMTLVHTPPVITSANNATFVAGSAGTFTVTTTGFPAPTIARGGVALPSGVTFTSNGDGTGTLSGTPAAGTGGTYAITFTASSAAGSTPAQSFTLTVNEAPTITSANSTTFTVGTNGNFQLTASGFPTTFTFTNTGNALPSGVSLSSAGLLSGTPAAGTGGTYSLTFQVSNGISPAGSQSFTLTVNQTPAFTSVDNTTFTVGTNGNFNVTANGFPSPSITLQSGIVPNTVVFTSGTGTATLSGTPNPGTGGVYNLVFNATNGVNRALSLDGTTVGATQNFTLTVNEAPSISSANSTTFTEGNFGSFNVTADGFPAPTFGATGTLPSAVTFAPSGLLSGTPDAGTAGSYPLQITAANGVGSDDVESFTLTVLAPVCVAPPADLVAWYPAAGNAVDAEGGHDGSALNGAGFGNGKVGQAFTFDGANAVVEVPDDPAWDFGSNAFTIETWVNFNAISGSDVLVAHSEGTGDVNKWIFWLRNGKLEFYLNVSGTTTASIASSATFTPIVGQWYHVAVTRSGTIYKFYVNGAQNGTDRFDSNSIPAANASLTLGHAEVISSLNGKLDEVKIFSRALSGAEIASIYNSSTEGLCVDALEATSAVSRKTHGAAGTFDVNLPLTGAPGVECRTGGANGDHTIVVTFNNVVTEGDASVSAGSVVGAPTFDGNAMTINLTGIANVQQITVSLSDVKDAFGQTLPNASVSMNVLLGDTTGNKAVNAGDIAQTKGQSGAPVNGVVGASNFRNDTNADGSINASDISQVKSVSGTTLP
jgi:hypothetical protein